MRKSIHLSIYPFIHLIIISIFCFTLVFPLNAQEATPSAIPDEKVTEKIKEQLEKVVDKEFDKIKDALSAKNYAYVGKITAITNDLLTLKTDGEEKQVLVASQAAILKTMPKKAKENIKLTDLQIDDFIIAMGPKKDNKLEGKRLLVTSQPQPAPKRLIIFGKVTEIDGKDLTLKSNGDQPKISLDDKTKLKIVGKPEAGVENIQIGDLATAVATLDTKEKIDVIKVILIIPGEANPAAAENNAPATPSASPKKP